MENLVIEPSKITTIEIKDSAEKFPVRRVYCIGRNYADHVIEMGNDPKEDPIFFKKTQTMSILVENFHTRLNQKTFIMN